MRNEGSTNQGSDPELPGTIKMISAVLNEHIEDVLEKTWGLDPKGRRLLARAVASSFLCGVQAGALLCEVGCAPFEVGAGARHVWEAFNKPRKAARGAKRKGKR